MPTDHDPDDDLSHEWEHAVRADTRASADENTAAAPSSDERPTPISLARDLREAVGGLFDVDPCSGCEPIPIGETRYTINDDGLAHDSPWYGSVFINPPYSNIDPWAEKAVRVTDAGDADYVVMLFPAYSLSSNWFQTHAPKASYLCVIDGRLTFYGADNGARFASLILVWTAPDSTLPSSLLNVLADWGEVFTHKEVEAAAAQLALEQFLASAETDTDTRATDGEMRAQVTPDHPDDPPLADLRVGDLLTLSYDADAVGFPADADISSNPTVRVLTGRERGDRMEVLCLAPDVPWNEGETYHLVTYDRENPWNIRAAVEVKTWRQLPLESVARAVSRGTVPLGQFVV